MSNIAIKVEDLSKYYRLGIINNGTLFRDIQSWMARISGKEDPNLQINHVYDPSKKGFWALSGINLEIEQGDRIGIIGKNGAGKSTLLKILSHITAPTEGCVKIRGRVASLLEVGTGFNGELTGRENIYLNGAILGMKKREVTRKLDEIISFSEIEEHIDTPVKRYSSGMYVRLAFAVAAHLDSEILIADEVLAVGDAAFQKKALGKMNDLSSGQGRTVLFVSHNINAVSSLCNKGALLDKGRLVKSGDLPEIISLYKHPDMEKGMEWTGDEGDINVRMLHTWVKAANGTSDILTTTMDIEIGICVHIQKSITGLILGFTLWSEFDYELAYILFDDIDRSVTDTEPGVKEMKFIIPGNTLANGNYRVVFDVGIHMKKRIIHEEGSLLFTVENTDGLGLKYPLPPGKGRSSFFRPNWGKKV